MPRLVQPIDRHLRTCRARPTAPTSALGSLQAYNPTPTRTRSTRGNERLLPPGEAATRVMAVSRRRRRTSRRARGVSVRHRTLPASGRKVLTATLSTLRSPRPATATPYASHDGNVYKNTGSGWQKYNGNGAGPTPARRTAHQARRPPSSWGDTQKSLNSTAGPARREFQPALPGSRVPATVVMVTAPAARGRQQQPDGWGDCPVGILLLVGAATDPAPAVGGETDRLHPAVAGRSFQRRVG